MIKVATFTVTGTKKPDTSLPKKFEEPENDLLIAQAIRVYEWGTHTGLSKTKTRGEILLTKAKWYRQKGTGRARHGAKSAPIFVGGSKTHGPKGLKRKLNLNKSMRKKALDTALSVKARSGEVVIVSSISTIKKTKDVQNLINKISTSKFKGEKNLKFTFVLADKNDSVVLALRNIPTVEMINFKDLNAYKVHFGGVLIMDNEVFAKTKPDTKKGEKKESIKK